MAQRSSRSPAVTVATFAFATAAATLALAWPSPTHADGAAALGAYTVDGWRVGDVVAKGQIQRDGTAKSGWVVVVTARNDADHAEDVPLETDVTRTAASPMARVMPIPVAVWSTREEVHVPAHGVLTRRYELPPAVATSIAAAKAAKKPAGRDAWRTPVVTFAVAFDPRRPNGAQGAPGPMDPAVLPPTVAD